MLNVNSKMVPYDMNLPTEPIPYVHCTVYMYSVQSVYTLHPPPPERYNATNVKHHTYRRYKLRKMVNEHVDCICAHF